MSLKLHRYLRRIGYGGPLSATRQTLHSLHRHHLLAIPFENIDVQLGGVPELEDEAIFEKIVKQQRGGWCFEMNLLFAWVLRQTGMRVDVIGATVNRTKAIEGAAINHAALLVHLDEPYLADVGFGNGSLAPMPLREGVFNDGRFDFKLTCHGNYWRFYNHKENGATYDFTGAAFDPKLLKNANRTLAKTSESPFVQTLVCARLTDRGMVTLANTALRVYEPENIVEETAVSAASLEHMLAEHFGLRTDRIEALWLRVADQHRRWVKKKIRGF
jgi:N-hydroxyarylamine O-acetyltransferase